VDMRKAVIVSLVILLLSISLLVTVVNANPFFQKGDYNLITINSPQNATYKTNSLTLNFTSKNNFNPSYLSYCYVIDGNDSILKGNIWRSMLKVETRTINQVIISNDSLNIRNEPYPPYTEYLIEGQTALPLLTDGNHNITIYQGPNYETNGVYSPLINVSFIIDTKPISETNILEISNPFFLSILLLIIIVVIASLLLLYFKRKRD
jgi:hypothetical protein